MNPFGAKCIFCKSMMITFDNISQYLNASRLSLDLKKWKWRLLRELFCLVSIRWILTYYGNIMKKIIVFFNSEPAVVVPAMTGVNTIMREYPNGEKTHLTVMAAGFPSLTGAHKVIYVAADRHVTSEEILEAAIRLLSWFDAIALIIQENSLCLFV